jgi:DNA-binding IclR family transcriptional regulator
MSKIVYRTIDFFEAFAREKRPLSLSELVKVLDIPLSSCHDVVQALEKRGYLYEVKPRAGYYPTVRLLDLARVIVEHDPVTLRAEPVLERLAHELNASISIAKAKGTQLTYLLVSMPTDPLRFAVAAGTNARNLYATSAGKALLASFSTKAQKEILAGIKLVPMTPATITSKTVLLRDLKQGEARGWFLNREESVEDALTISTRFMWSGSIYVITAAGTLRRMERQLDAAVAALMSAARQLEQSE